MATEIFKKLAQTVVGTVWAAAYTAPASGQAIIKRTIAANPCAAAWLQLAQGGSGFGCLILPRLSIACGARSDDSGLLTLLCGDTIWAIAQTANSIILTFEGLEIT